MNSFIYLRVLRHADHTVFCVQDGQKYYWDNQFGVKVAFSSGQQVKRSVLDSVLEALGENQAPITFNYEITKDKSLAYKEPWSPCDPNYTDQLLGGWMKAGSNLIALKRRSPFSFSAMRPLHPLLGGIEKQEENLTFDRSSNPDIHPVNVRDSKGNLLSEEEIIEFLKANNRTLSRRNFIQDQTRVSGLFVNDIAIDLRTLFCVSMNQHEPELRPEMIEQLKAAGWVESKNAFGKCLVCPKEKRDRMIPAIAHGILNWRITSNQARTFSLLDTLAVAISENANRIAGAIRASLDENIQRRAAVPIVDEKAGAELFVTLPCSGYVRGIEGSPDALEQAEKRLIEMMQAFDYEHQVKEEGELQEA